MKKEAAATTLQLIGAGLFGLVIGWFLYYLNRYRKDVALTDLATVVGAVGAGAVLTLFPAKTDLFAAYGIGFAAGFFAYFLVLVVCVAISKDVGVGVFLGVPVPGAPEQHVMDAPQPLNG